MIKTFCFLTAPPIIVPDQLAWCPFCRSWPFLQFSSFTHDPVEMNITNRLKTPCLSYPLGTDEYSRDMLSRIIHGAGASLRVSTSSLLILLIIGTVIRAMIGYYGGLVERVISRNRSKIQQDWREVER